MDEKYVVFKRADLEAILDKTHNYNIRNNLEEIEINNYIVLRLQDAFAEAALIAYANTVLTTARTIGELAPSTRDRLFAIGIYVSNEVARFESYKKKLPD